MEVVPLPVPGQLDDRFHAELGDPLVAVVALGEDAVDDGLKAAADQLKGGNI